MKYFVIFFETKDSDAIKAVVEFKKKINDEPITTFTVVETIASNYDFLYNSLIETARKEEKHPSTKGGDR